MSEKRLETDENSDIFFGKILFNKYNLTKKIGKGAFGSIYEAKSISSQKLYAIKIEKIKDDSFLLEEEALILSYLNCNRIPKVKSFGYSGNYMILVMELLGKSLDKILNELPKKKLSIRCTCNIAYQLISIIEVIHNNNIIHRDIKPGNIAIGFGDKSKFLYFLDFGLSKKYRSSTTKTHFPFTENNKLVGNVRYSSINTLEGGTQSRRDDLESIGYLLIFLLLGHLPWQGKISNSKEDKYYKIREIKKSTTAEELCKGLPNQFKEYIEYTRNLKYDEEPDYNYLKNLFLSILKNMDLEIDYYYDWDKTTIPHNEIKNICYYSYDEYIKIPKLYSKIIELEKERTLYGGNFEVERFVFDIEEDSTFNYMKRNNENEKENEQDGLSYTNSMAPYTNNKRRIKQRACCQPREYKENESCCLIC
jgi:serine/threonine protein kinase